MGRPAAPWASYKLQSALQANSWDFFESGGVLHARRSGGSSVAVSQSDHAEQVCFARCKTRGGGGGGGPAWCGHLKLCTPQDIREARCLVCQLCATAAYMKRLRLRGFSDLQLSFMQRLDAELPRSHWVWEANAIPGWPGRVDVLLLQPCWLVVQVDGSQHCEGHMLCAATRHTQQARDWECAKRAVEAGVPMVRLHHVDLVKDPQACWLLMQRVLSGLQTERLAAPLLVLSPAFNSMRVTHSIVGDTPYAQALATHVGLPPPQQASGHAAIVLTV